MLKQRFSVGKCTGGVQTDRRYSQREEINIQIYIANVNSERQSNETRVSSRAFIVRHTNDTRSRLKANARLENTESVPEVLNDTMLEGNWKTESVSQSAHIRKTARIYFILDMAKHEKDHPANSTPKQVSSQCHRSTKFQTQGRLTPAGESFEGFE